ncbi:MAG: hypothetical protein JNK38_09475 [Acidobacteria bacterium]|nr:hypothetical protein [Acidobacteriota bacterium]
MRAGCHVHSAAVQTCRSVNHSAQMGLMAVWDYSLAMNAVWDYSLAMNMD